jgi:hypothetical protein
METNLDPVINSLYVSLVSTIKQLEQLELYKIQIEAQLNATIFTVETCKQDIMAIKCLLCKFNTDSDIIQKDRLDSTLVDCESCPRKTTCTHRH